MSSEEQIRLMRILACMLHGTLFGALNELRKEKDLFGLRTGLTLEEVQEDRGRSHRGKRLQLVKSGRESL